MRGHSTRQGVLRDGRRRAWVAICPASEFVVAVVDEARAPRPGPLPEIARRRRKPPRFTGVDAFVLSLIGCLYGSLFYCLSAVVR
jgi:hypothetical protein